MICFGAQEVQLITAGTDRRIGYWEIHDGSLIRELDASRSGSINGMDITNDGQAFVTGGDDEIVKVNYQTFSKVCETFDVNYYVVLASQLILQFLLQYLSILTYLLHVFNEWRNVSIYCEALLYSHEPIEFKYI